MDTVTLSIHEQELVKVVRRLPAERIAQVVEFAQFLEYQANQTNGENAAELAAADARWEALLASEESQQLLEKMADEAWTQIQAGQAKPMVFTEDGDLVPG